MTVTHLEHREGYPGHFGILHAIWPKSDLGHFCFRVTIYVLHHIRYSSCTCVFLTCSSVSMSTASSGLMTKYNNVVVSEASSFCQIHSVVIILSETISHILHQLEQLRGLAGRVEKEISPSLPVLIKGRSKSQI